jgi:hypothetical protein
VRWTGEAGETIVTVPTEHIRNVLILGHAGVGKTALLEYLLDEASGSRVVRAAGAEAEMELAYAGLQQLCAPMLDGLERLPAPQRDALGDQPQRRGRDHGGCHADRERHPHAEHEQRHGDGGQERVAMRNRLVAGNLNRTGRPLRGADQRGICGRAEHLRTIAFAICPGSV